VTARDDGNRVVVVVILLGVALLMLPAFCGVL
jgi:hypothetical protein